MIDKKLYIATLSLLFISLVAVYSLSIFPTLYFETNEFTFLKKQAISVAVAVFLLTLISHMNPYTVFRPLGFMIFIGSFIAIVLMLILPDSFVRAVLGAKRWIKFGGVSIAPTEFFKVGFIFFLSWSIARKYEALQKAKSVFDEFMVVLPYFFVFALAALIIAIGQKDLGQVVVLGVIFLALLYLTNRSKAFFSTLFLLAVSGVVTLIVLAPHRVYRFKGWWAEKQDFFLQFLPESLAKALKVTDTTVPLHIINSKNAIYHGGFLGQGLGNGQFKLGYLSEVHTDFVLAGMSEEIGLLGVIAVVAILFYVIYRVILIGNKLKLLNEKLFAYGVALMLAISFLINAFGITGIIPIKGIAVPFLSYGGSQIIASSIAIAMVLMLSRKVEK